MNRERDTIIVTGRSGQTILIVEDDDLLLKSLAMFVRWHGFTVARARSAESALETFGLRQIDLCIVDYHLPGMDGVAFIRELRRRSVRVPVLLMSGYLNTAIRMDALAEGALDVLHKPVDMGRLGQRLDHVLGAGPAA